MSEDFTIEVYYYFCLKRPLRMLYEQCTLYRRAIRENISLLLATLTHRLQNNIVANLYDVNLFKLLAVKRV